MTKTATMSAQDQMIASELQNEATQAGVTVTAKDIADEVALLNGKKLSAKRTKELKSIGDKIADVLLAHGASEGDDGDDGDDIDVDNDAASEAGF